MVLLGGLSPLAAAEDTVVRFAVIGDMGVGCDAKDGNQCKIADWMCAYRDFFDFVITLGDNIYPDGNPADFPAKFEMPYRCLLDQDVPFYASLGNHDTESNRWRYENANVNYRYYNMFDDRDLVKRRYYSYRKGAVMRNEKTVPLVEFLALDSNRVSYPTAPPDPDQIPWLTQRLQESDAVWKIPYFHHPLYTSSPDSSETIVRNTFEQIFIDYGIKIVFYGHKHQFEEVLPQNGIRYILSGAAGRLNPGGTRRSSPLLEKFNDRQPHFLLVEVTEQILTWYLVDGNGEATCYTRQDPTTPVECWGQVLME